MRSQSIQGDFYVASLSASSTSSCSNGQNLCLNKARDYGIRTARLPIGRYLASLPTRKVLTVNQVFEILVKWVETKDWEQAFYHVIPKRKFQGGIQTKSGPANDDDTAELEEPAVEASQDVEAILVT